MLSTTIYLNVQVAKPQAVSIDSFCSFASSIIAITSEPQVYIYAASFLSKALNALSPPFTIPPLSPPPTALACFAKSCSATLPALFLLPILPNTVLPVRFSSSVIFLPLGLYTPASAVSCAYPSDGATLPCTPSVLTDDVVDTPILWPLELTLEPMEL